MCTNVACNYVHMMWRKQRSAGWLVVRGNHEDYVLSHAKPDAIVMHPGPMNRGVEIDGTLADDINRSVIQDQVEMGVAVRMAAMDLLARNLRLTRGAA